MTGNDGDDVTVFNAGGTDWDQFDGSPSSGMDMGVIDPSLHPGYEGTGTFNIDYVVNQVGSSTSAGGVFRQIDPVTAAGNLTVTYEYEPVDPPSCSSIEIDKYLWDVTAFPISAPTSKLVMS